LTITLTKIVVPFFARQIRVRNGAEDNYLGGAQIKGLSGIANCSIKRSIVS
jgi:hypothetical protein